MKFSNDDFIRTTEQRNIDASQALWRAMAKAAAPDGNPAIYLGSYAGWYAVRDEAFYDEGELRDGPDGTKIAPSGAPVAWVEEPSYFFRLSAYGEALLAHYEAYPDFIAPASRRNEVVSFVKGGLRDLSISRTSFSWGTKVPGDEKHVMYVWLDALVNYIAALGYPETGAGSNYAHFWPADLHMVGKDILRFHTVYWPAFLLAAGLPLPKRVFAHGWWTIEGQKMSKSLGNVIAPSQLVGTYGLDQTRYVLLAEVPFGNDGDFSHATVVRRLNADLANGLGNLAQRTLTLIQKNCGGSVPAPGAFTPADLELLAHADGLIATCRTEIVTQRFHECLKAVWSLIATADGYIDAQAPWALKKTDPARMATVLYVLAETIRAIATLLQPFMPDSMSRLLDQLGVASDRRDFSALGESGRLKPSAALPPPQGVLWAP